MAYGASCACSVVDGLPKPRVVHESARREAQGSALSELCATCWPPVHALILRELRDREKAKDLTQSFFLRLLERRDIVDAPLDSLRFRCFLAASVRHFLCNSWDRERALKRGGGRLPSSLDLDDLGWRYEPVDALTPERVFERKWAASIVEGALYALRREWDAAGKRQEFEAIEECLTGDSTVPYEVIGRRLGKTAAAIKVKVHRMRVRFRVLLRNEIARPVADAAEVDGELRFLYSVLSS